MIFNGEPLEEVDSFKYLGSQVASDGGCERDMVHRMNGGHKAWGALKSVRKMTVEAAHQCAKDMKEWRAPVHM